MSDVASTGFAWFTRKACCIRRDVMLVEVGEFGGRATRAAFAFDSGGPN
jgi:hypothetical protein